MHLSQSFEYNYFRVT